MNQCGLFMLLYCSMSKDTISLKQFELGPMQNFVYVLGCDKTKEFAIIDPAWDVAPLIDEVEKRSGKITAVLLTHGHHDHLNALDNVLNASSVEQGIPVYFSSLFSKLRPKLDNIVLVDDGQKINLGNLSITCIQTPGHSPCGVAYHVGKHLIAGDTLFVDGCGRCDFEQSNVEHMYDSIHNKVMVLPDDTIIYPGHHYGNKPFDTLENQRKTNRFMNCGAKEKFIRLRMGF